MSSSSSPDSDPDPILRTLAEHTAMKWHEWFKAFIEGPEDAARVLQLIDDEEYKNNPKAFYGDDQVWMVIDEPHKFYLRMDAKQAATIGMQLVMAAGQAVVLSKKVNHDAPQNQTPD